MNSQNYENLENGSILRCPHDAVNPYTMIKNDLIRDESISPNCRWLLIYLLSNKDGWVINFNQVLTHVLPHMARKSLLKVFNEAIEAGYIKREQLKNKNKFARVVYYVSEFPKFKKCLSRSQFELAQKGQHKKEHSSFSSATTPNSKEKTTTAKQKKEQPCGASSSFFKCLEKCIDLSEDQKKKLRKYDPDLLDLVIQYVYNPRIEIENGSLGRFKFIQFLLKESKQQIIKRLEEINSSKKTANERITEGFVMGRRYNGFEYFYDTIGFGFIHPSGNVYSVRWDSPSKKEEFKNLLKKLGVKK